MEIKNFHTQDVHKFIEFIEKNKNDLTYFYPHKMDYENLINMLEKNKLDHYKIVVQQNEIIGYGILRGWEEGYEIPSLGIMIDKNFRGIGLSKLVMNYLEVLSKIMGSKNIRLVVHKNNVIAYNLYKRLNYEFSEHSQTHLIGLKKI